MNTYYDYSFDENYPKNYEIAYDTCWDVYNDSWFCSKLVLGCACDTSHYAANVSHCDDCLLYDTDPYTCITVNATLNSSDW